MRKNFSIAVVLAVLVAIAFSASAKAAVPWGGFGSNDLGSATIVLSTQNGRVTVKSVQVVMACVDAEDGTESERAFSIGSGPTQNLNQNRFNFNFSKWSGGRRGQLHLTGRLGSNGHGTARLDMTAVGKDEMNRVVERCQASVNYNIRRPVHR